MTLPEKFRAAIKKGVHDIQQGELRKLNPVEKRQLLADLRKRGDCPDGWKNRKNMTPKKQRSILCTLSAAIYRLLNPEKAKAASTRSNKKKTESGQVKAANDRNNDRNNKRNRENGKAKAANARNHKKYKENGQQKIWNDRKCAKRAKATREANARAILENKDHHEPTWDEDTLEKEATGIVEYIVKRCGPDGFVHVFVGAWPGQDLNKAVEAECFGRGRHAVFIDGGRRVHYHHVSDHVKLLIPYTGINCLNADDLEERVQKKLLDMEWPQHRRMFTKAGAGTCRGPATDWTAIPFPYYTGVLVCEQSMEQIGIRLTTEKDRASRKRKRSSSSSSSSSL
jgi:DNA mismatch repair ATPase MutL